MPQVSLEDIIEPSDYKIKDQDEFNLLKDSISRNGLFHPLILQGDEGPYKIIAGKARFFAIKSLSLSSLTATILPDDCINPLEIALEENLRRDNIQWYDLVEYEKQYHDLKIAQFGQNKGGRPKKDAPKSGWSQVDSANALGLALGTFSQDMALADELKRNPNLRNVKDKTTALKLIKNITKRQIAEIEQLMPSEFELDEVLLGDSTVILKSLPSSTFDLCITDPPWSEYKDENLRSDQEAFLPIWHELFRVLKRDAIVFIVTSFTDFPFFRKELPKLGFRVQHYPIIWHKTKTITHGRAAWQFARDYEPIIVAVKGDPSLTTGTELSSILRYDNLHYTKMIHPHEKPLELIQNLIRIASHPGAKVIDVFAGSGVTLEACKKNDRRYLGIEKNKEFYDKIVERLRK